MNHHWEQAQIYSVYAKHTVYCLFKARKQPGKTQETTFLFREITAKWISSIQQLGGL